MNNQIYLAKDKVHIEQKKCATDCLIVSIQHLNNSFLADIFKLSTNLALHTWKESQFIMLKKPKKHREKAENYKTISPTNCLVNVCLNLLQRTLSWELMNNQIYLAKDKVHTKQKKCATDSLILSIQHLNKSYLADIFKLSQQLLF